MHTDTCYFSIFSQMRKLHGPQCAKALFILSVSDVLVVPCQSGRTKLPPFTATETEHHHPNRDEP